VNNNNLRWLAGAAVLVLALSLGASAQTPDDCSDPNSILNSTYGWQLEGRFEAGVSANAADAPLVSVGYFTFDGNGNFSGAHDTNLAGRLVPHSDFGTYTVNPDCTTGTISRTSGAGFIMAIVIVGSGEEIKFVGVNGVAYGTLRRMAAAPCSASTLAGKSYGYATHGLMGSGAPDAFPRIGGFVPFTNAGLISFQSDGNVSGMDNLNLGGVFMPGQSIAGTYSVNPDCTGTTTLTIGGVGHSWNFVILEGGEEVFFIATPSGLVWAGTLTAIN